MMTNIDGPIKVGSHDFYKNRFMEALTSDNQKKCIEYFNSEYCDESGVWQYVSHTY
jgi:hypothetical protein